MKTLLTGTLPFFILMLIFMSGCASGPVLPEKIQEAGLKTYPENYKELINQYFEDRLKAPFSAKYRFIERPQKAYQRFPPVQDDGDRHIGYLVFVDVNAKNSYGGYTGWEEFRFLIRDGRIVHRFTRNPHFWETWYR
jgi:hypothetical protein